MCLYVWLIVVDVLLMFIFIVGVSVLLWCGLIVLMNDLMSLFGIM